MAREFLEHVAYEAMEKTVFAENPHHQTVMRNGTHALAQRYGSSTSNRNFAHPGVQRPSPNRASPLRSSKSVDVTPQHSSSQNGASVSNPNTEAVQDGFIRQFFMGFFGKGKKTRNHSNSSTDGVTTNRTPDHNSNKDSATASENTDLDSYEVVENIELAHMNGFVLGSKRELGRGHEFECLQLKSATWCDNCGGFIWGVDKQCLVCKCKSILLFL